MQNLKAGAMLYPLETFSSALMAPVLRFWNTLSLLKESLLLLVLLGPRGEEANPSQGPVLQHPLQLGKFNIVTPTGPKHAKHPPQPDPSPQGLWLPDPVNCSVLVLYRS